MPTYTYRCRTCEARFDYVQSMVDPALTNCPAQGGPAECIAPDRGEVAKVFGAVGITFKGSGFYKTDSRASSKAGRRSANGKEKRKEKEAAGTRSDSSAGPRGDGASSGTSSTSPSSASSGSSGSGSSGSGSSGSGSSGSGSSAD
jgi:putative FmdB family regulatory protein